MGGTNLELAKAVVEAAGKDCRVTIAGGVTTRRGDRGARRDRRRRPGRHGALYRPARSRRRDHGAAGHRPAGRALSDRRRRRARRLPRAGLLVARNRSARRCGGGWASTSPAAAACGSRARPAAPPRSCCVSTSTAIATARASSCARPGPGFCHLDTRTCWGEDDGLGRLARTLAERRAQAPAGSYTAKLFADPALLGAKLREEADELPRAATASDVDLGSRRRALFHAGAARARGHRPRRGRGASRPAGAEGDAARMRGWTDATGVGRPLAPMLERRILIALVLLAGGIWGFVGLADEVREGERSASTARSSCCSATPAIRAIRSGRCGSSSRCATSLRWAASRSPRS